MRIVMTGADGQLGQALQQALTGDTLVRLVWPDFDLLKPDVEEQIVAARPDAVIHAAAYTNVDQAEQESAMAMAVNGKGTARVAQAAETAGARLLYISTDYVFDGGKGTPYREEDPPNPLSVYGHSKLEGERAALQACRNTLVVRTSWLYGREGHNFVKTIMRLARERSELRVVDDQRGAPTHAGDLAAVLAALVDSDARGIIHAAGMGDCTWHEFASTIVELLGAPVAVHRISTAEAGRLARRPPYSVLSTSALAQRGLALPHWKDAVNRFIHAQETAPAQS